MGTLERIVGDVDWFPVKPLVAAAEQQASLVNLHEWAGAAPDSCSEYEVLGELGCGRAWELETEGRRSECCTWNADTFIGPSAGAGNLRSPVVPAYAGK